jgi:hypothetical protein
MSGIPNNSTRPSEIEEEISLDESDDDDSTITIDDNKKIEKPPYFECTEEYSAFDSGYVEDKESSSS